jgi:hypothetical protein
MVYSCIVVSTWSVSNWFSERKIDSKRETVRVQYCMRSGSWQSYRLKTFWDRPLSRWLMTGKYRSTLYVRMVSHITYYYITSHHIIQHIRFSIATVIEHWTPSAGWKIFTVRMCIENKEMFHRFSWYNNLVTSTYFTYSTVLSYHTAQYSHHHFPSISPSWCWIHPYRIVSYRIVSSIINERLNHTIPCQSHTFTARVSTHFRIIHSTVRYRINQNIYTDTTWVSASPSPSPSPSLDIKSI